MPGIARACCCACPTSIIVTLSGVDASACCRPVGGVSDKMDPLSVDGSYSFSGTPGGFYLPDDLVGSFGTKKRYSDVACGGAVTNTYTLTRLCGGGFLCFQSIVGIDADCTITSVLIRIGDLSSSAADATVFQWSGSASLGDAISNQLVCGDVVSSADGGTAVITSE